MSEIAAPFGISLQAVSRHIQVLVRAGLVSQARSGRISRCSLDAEPERRGRAWLNRYAKYWQAQFDLLAVTLEDLETRHRQKIPKGGSPMLLNTKSSLPPNGPRRGSKLLAREKEFTRLRDELSAERRTLPWVRVEKKYMFEGPDGRKTLAELFAGRSQLDRAAFHAWRGLGDGLQKLLLLGG